MIAAAARAAGIGSDHPEKQNPVIDLSIEATRIGTLRWTAPRTSSSSRPGVHSKKRSDHSFSSGSGSLEDNWGASKSLVVSKGLLLKSPAIALRSNKASLRYNSEKLTLTKCTHTIRRLPQEFTHRKKLFQRQPRSLVNEAKQKPFGSSSSSSKLSDLSVPHQPVLTTSGNKQTNKVPSNPLPEENQAMKTQNWIHNSRKLLLYLLSTGGRRTNNNCNDTHKEGMKAGRKEAEIALGQHILQAIGGKQMKRCRF